MDCGVIEIRSGKGSRDTLGSKRRPCALKDVGNLPEQDGKVWTPRKEEP